MWFVSFCSLFSPWIHSWKPKHCRRMWLLGGVPKFLVEFSNFASKGISLYNLYTYLFPPIISVYHHLNIVNKKKKTNCHFGLCYYIILSIQAQCEKPKRDVCERPKSASWKDLGDHCWRKKFGDNEAVTRSTQFFIHRLVFHCNSLFLINLENSIINQNPSRIRRLVICHEEMSDDYNRILNTRIFKSPIHSYNYLCGKKGVGVDLLHLE